MPTYYLGLDVHKVCTQYCLVDALGEILREGSVPTEEAAALVLDRDTVVVLEATGSWHATYDALLATGAAVKLAHPARGGGLEPLLLCPATLRLLRHHPLGEGLGQCGPLRAHHPGR